MPRSTLHPKRRRRLLAAAAGASVAAVGARLAERTAEERARRRDAPGLEGLGLAFPEGEERVVTTDDGAEISCTIAGPADGTPSAVLAHGWTEDRRVWSIVAHLLVARGWRVVAYDHRGHGRSLPGSDPYSIERLAGDLGTVFSELGIRDAVLAGHSMGGIAAQASLIADPDVLNACAGLVLVATTAQGVPGPTHRAMPARALSAAFSSRLADSTLERDRVGPWLMRTAFGKGPAWSHLLATRDMYLQSAPVARAKLMQAIIAVDLLARLDAIKVPTTVLAGEYDILLPSTFGRNIAERVPGAHFELVPGAGHMLPFEAPERVVDAIVSTPERA